MHRMRPADIARLDVDLDQRLPVHVEQSGMLPEGVAGGEARADSEHDIGFAQHRSGGFEPVVANHAGR